MLKIFLNIILILLISACSSTSTTSTIKYYLLDSKPTPINYQPSEKLIQIRPVSVPNYLNQPNLVLKESNQQIKIANYHTWADNLSDAIRRVIAYELNSKHAPYSVVTSCNECDTLDVTVNHFYPTTDGEVLLSGSYILILDNKNIFREHFMFSKAIEADGYDESVKQMRQLLIKLSEQINISLSLD